MTFNFKYKLFLIIILIFIILIKDNFLKLFLFDTPFVSIIILVKNKFDYINDCISSIINTQPKKSFELILIFPHNGGGLITEMEHLKKFSNIKIKIIKNNKNINCFLNIKKAVRLSKGKYLLFLKDNTKVYKNWLSSLIKLFEKDSKIGMIGSKIINPDGVLKNAGGIVWNNGQFLNFGKGNISKFPEYNYVKQVDFISGTSIIIRKVIFKKIGGFSENYLSINYIIIDLAFKIRKYGYKVIYQPISVVMEYNLSFYNTMNMPNSIEETDKKIFYESWKKDLKYQLEPGNTYIAKDRCLNKNRILVIDEFIPMFDNDAGSRCSFSYINIFKELGFQVTFLPNDLRKREPYCTILQQNGIEVLYGKMNKDNNLGNWFKDNLKYFKYFYLQRPSASKKYINLIKNYSSNKIIYFAHDLHHIRLMRQYNVTHDRNKYLESQYIKNVELEIFSKVNIIYVVGGFEYKILKEKIQNKIVRNIPLYIYENQYENLEKDFSKREGLIFVGGMHDTNIDAVIWFSKEVYPLILNKFPDMIWYIVTNKVYHIKNLESKSIKMLYKLSDKDLHLMYQKSRIAIAPLRFGAGVKGKVVEAAYNQIPMVTTSIGAEGLDKSIGSFVIADNSKKMAEIICELYLDFPKLKKMSDSGKLLIYKYFSKKLAKEITFYLD
jgi:GT2 family glycosyltransferase